MDGHALINKIRSRSARVSVIGLGYVGLPLSVAFADAGLDVTGIDVDAEKAAAINAATSYIGDVKDADLARVVSGGKLRATTDYEVLREVDAVVVCVPTPLRKTRDPDISYVIQAADEIASRAHPGMLVVLESTTYPGTTEEVLLPRLDEQGLRVGESVFLAFSPERIDPGNKTYGIRNTPKVVGGQTPACTEVAAALYECAVETVVRMSSPSAAEMVKLLENTFRAVNIGLANEMALICNRLGLNVWEVIAAASTKPYGFTPFFPGPGLGGHCIPIDPLYLAWKLKSANFEARFISLADDINSHMPHYVVAKIADALNEAAKPIRGSRIIVLGAAYKPNVGDVRESPALDIITSLAHKGGQVSYHDPHVDCLATDDGEMQSVELTEDTLKAADCVVIVTNHDEYDWQWITQNSQLIVDTRNALKDVSAPETRVVTI